MGEENRRSLREGHLGSAKALPAPPAPPREARSFVRMDEKAGASSLSIHGLMYGEVTGLDYTVVFLE